MSHDLKWVDKLSEKWIQYLERDTIQKSLRVKVIDPILNHILKRVFPYILLICIMFCLLLIAVLITLGTVLFQSRMSVSFPAPIFQQAYGDK